MHDTPEDSQAGYHFELPHTRDRWFREPNYIPYSYLKPAHFKAKLTKLLQRGGCNKEQYDRWLQLYNEKRRKERSVNHRKGRMDHLWTPYFEAMGREIASANSSIIYAERAKRDSRKPAVMPDYDARIEANRYYRQVLRETIRELKRQFMRADKTPNETWEWLGRTGKPEWPGFVPKKKQDKVRAMFAALTPPARGRAKLPFALSHAQRLGIEAPSETSHQPVNEERVTQPEPKKGDQPKPFDINDPDNWN